MRCCLRGKLENSATRTRARWVIESDTQCTQSRSRAPKALTRAEHAFSSTSVADAARQSRSNVYTAVVQAAPDPSDPRPLAQGGASPLQERQLTCPLSGDRMHSAQD
jgi:hypothetical protein